MIRTIVTAFAAASIALLGAGVASADVISQSTSEESHQKTSREGTSANAVDHMANEGPGIVEGDTPGHVWTVVRRVPVLDENGDKQYDQFGNVVTEPVFGWAPAPSGPAPATIVKN